MKRYIHYNKLPIRVFDSFMRVNEFPCLPAVSSGTNSFFNISITKIISFSFVFNYHNNQEQMLQKILE